MAAETGWAVPMRCPATLRARYSILDSILVNVTANLGQQRFTVDWMERPNPLFLHLAQR